MGDGARLAIAILVLFLAMVCFFFAFHPGGVQGANNPADILKFMFTQFDQTSNGTGASANSPSGAAVAPVNNPSSNLTNLPGTNIGPVP